MCGRYYRRSEKQRIAEVFSADVPPTLEILPSYNVAPQSFQPVVRIDPDSGERMVARMRWGLVPFWARNAKSGYSTINAKAETIRTSPAFREALKHRRCIVPADGFFEWQKSGGEKQPFAIALKDGGLFGFAGMWETWKDKETRETLETFTIITTDPNELIRPLGGPAIHDRMPVILSQRDFARWLAPCDPAQPPTDVLRAYPAEEMTAWKVSVAVGNVRNNRPDLITAI